MALPSWLEPKTYWEMLPEETQELLEQEGQKLKEAAEETVVEKKTNQAIALVLAFVSMLAFQGIKEDWFRNGLG